MLLNDISVQLVDTWGDDLKVVNAARVSFDKHSNELKDNDDKLIKYLAKHGHWTPFAHCGATFRIKAPMYVARQCIRHQVGLMWNEVSRRYVNSEPEFHTPMWRQAVKDKKQGSGADFSDDEMNRIDSEVLNVYDHALGVYNELLASGMAEEHARIVLPVAVFTEWYWSGSMVAFDRICKLRLSPDAQQETGEVAKAIDAELKEVWPISWLALREGRDAS